MMIFRILQLVRAGVRVPWSTILGMGLRGSLDRNVTEALIVNHQANLGLDLIHLEAHGLAKGNPKTVALAVKKLRESNVEDAFMSCAALDLAGMSVPDVGEAFLQVRRIYPEFRFNDVVARAVRGEDVLAAARSGALRPNIR